MALARKLGMPIKWNEYRSEGYLATIHGRDVIQDMEVAATEEGKMLGFRVKLHADFGRLRAAGHAGHPDPRAPSTTTASTTARPTASSCTGVFTNKTPTDAYRGAGRPEATYAVERIMDALARRVGKDPAEIREMNFIPPFDEARDARRSCRSTPATTQATMDKAKELAGYDKLREEQQANDGRRDGKLLGVGISTYIEMCGLAPSQILGAVKYGAGGWEAATDPLPPDRQGHRDHRDLAARPGARDHLVADHRRRARGRPRRRRGAARRHGRVGASAWTPTAAAAPSVGAVALVQRRPRRSGPRPGCIAAHELEVAEEDLEWNDGKFQVSGAPDRAKTIPEVAFSAWTAHALPAEVDPGLEATGGLRPAQLHLPVRRPTSAWSRSTRRPARPGSTSTWPSTTAAPVINPMIVDGQVMGGVAQGIAEALYEEALYDENGTLLTGNMSTYRIPSAAELPGFTLDRDVTPSTTNPLGIKGIGEAGTIASPAGGDERGRRRAALRRGRVHRQAGLRRAGLACRPGGRGQGAGRARRPRAAAPARPV